MKPTVLQLIDSFNQGGSERQALQLTRLLLESKHFNVRLASLSAEGTLRDEVANLDLGEIPAFPLNKFYDGNAFLQLRRLVRFLKVAKVQILHTHDFYTNVFGMAAGSIARVPVRIASMRETSGLRTGTQKSLQQLAYSRAHCVVANSEAVRNELVRQGVAADKVEVIYNGIDLERVQASPASNRKDSLALLGLPDSLDGQNRFITLVANMRLEVKDHAMFLRAAQRIYNADRTTRFLLAGEGDLMPALKKTVGEMGLSDAVFFLGRCEHLGNLLSVSDVCVLSSKAEGFSNSILEYMAAGRAVVATDVGGAREVVVEGRTGHIVPSGNDEALAAAVLNLLRNPELERFGEEGRRIVQERFSVEAQLRQTEDLYERLLSQK